jgi:hypothetical protein
MPKEIIDQEKNDENARVIELSMTSKAEVNEKDDKGYLSESSKCPAKPIPNREGVPPSHANAHAHPQMSERLSRGMGQIQHLVPFNISREKKGRSQVLWREE